MDIIQEALNILKINSVSQTGNIEIVQYVSKLLQAINLPIEIQSTTHRGIPQQNIITRINGKSSKEILFNTHLDTVSPGDPMKWTMLDGKPFEPKIIENKIYGLGSADTKIDYLCKLKALSKYKNEKFTNPLTFVGTFGEEMGLIGCEYFLNSGYVKPKYTFVGEPTALNLVYAHKGMIVIRIDTPFHSYNNIQPSKSLEFTGESAHGSTPHLGKSAFIEGITHLKSLPEDLEIVEISGGSAVNMVPIDLTMKLSSYPTTPNRNKILQIFKILDNIEQNLKNDLDSDYNPPYSVLNIGTIRIEQEKLVMRMAFRMLPKRDFNPILKEIQQSLSQIQGEAILERDQPAMYTDRNGFLIQTSLKILNEMAIPAQIETKPASTEAALYEKWGAQSVIFGPGIAMGNIHKPNEYNYIDHIEKAVLFYERVIEVFCLSEIP